MAELVAQSLIHDNHSTSLEVISSTPLCGGGAEEKAILTARVQRKTVGHGVISLIKRPYCEDYANAWHSFRDAGLPVAPTLRKASYLGRRCMVATDVKAQGGEVYGKGMAILLESGIPRERAHTQADEAFLRITGPDNWPRLKRQAGSLILHAQKHRIALPDDDPMELLVHPNGDHQLITLDLTRGYQLPRDASPEAREKIDADNIFFTHYFLEHLLAIRVHLKARVSSRLSELALAGA